MNLAFSSISVRTCAEYGRISHRSKTTNASALRRISVMQCRPTRWSKQEWPCMTTRLRLRMLHSHRDMGYRCCSGVGGLLLLLFFFSSPSGDHVVIYLWRLSSVQLAEERRWSLQRCWRQSRRWTFHHCCYLETKHLLRRRMICCTNVGFKE